MSVGIDCRELADWMDELLDVRRIEDYPGALNGLQVEASRPVRKVGAATDACLESIERAVDGECQLLVVHHGLFWGGARPLVGPTYRRFRRLIESGVGVYSAHLPLDAHPEIGNNALLARRVGLESPSGFGAFKGLEGLGLIGDVALSRAELVDRVRDVCGSEPFVIPGGGERVERLAIVTGGAGSLIEDASAAGADTFLTGEGNHHTYHEAMELGVNVIYAGHYATETLGVRALAEAVAARFDLEHSFFDVPTGL